MHCSQPLPQQRGFPKFPESPRPCSLGLRSPWGVDGQGRSRKAWRGGYPGQPHSLCLHRHFSPDPTGQQGLRMSEARDSCQATRPAPLPQSQALFSAQKAWSKAWKSSLEPAPRGKENIVYRQKQSRMQGRGAGFVGEALLWDCMGAHRHWTQSVCPHPQTDSLFMPLRRQTEHDLFCAAAGWHALGARSLQAGGQALAAGLQSWPCCPPAMLLQASDPRSPGLTGLGGSKSHFG